MFKLPDDVWDWLKAEWFSADTLLSFDWYNPLFLYLLPVVPLLYLIRWLFAARIRKRLDIALFEGKSVTDWSSKLRYLPGIAFAVFLMLVLVALARPQRTNEQVEQSTEGIDIMLVLDISGSMRLQDFKPNRLEAAKEVAENFINGRFQDRIGAVVFAGDAYSLSPLTTDYDLLLSNIRTINFNMIANDGTAIGNALAVATNRMRESKAKSKVCILLSDGENTAGQLDPALAARLAHAYGIKIYTIGIGKDGRVPYEVDEIGGTVYVETRLDESNLREIAAIGEGQFFRATNADALKEIFRNINRYEKAEIKETRFRDTKDYYQVYLKWAVIFLLLWLLMKSTFLTNAMED
ncbi:MAG: VWA domain-containing protein [Hymenobacteraceae bacterium]|nr:VWA domain-containing protein [Hymenobacteraceae bacterium]